MKTLQTTRLALRGFTPGDAAAVQSYAGDAQNTTYMVWGPNTEQQTRGFTGAAIAAARETPCRNYQYAAVMKETGRLVGACNLLPAGDEAEIGWILHRDYWGRGLGVEMGRALLAFGFTQLGMRRITAHCDVENTSSLRVMEKLGMRREGLFIEGHPGNKQSGRPYRDEQHCAILRDEWEAQSEAERYTALPVSFSGFITVPPLADGEVYLVCTAKRDAIPEKGYVPAYDFALCVKGERIGSINLRIGYTAGLYYGGQVGYAVDEAHRGNGYAARACRLLSPVARAHGMQKLLITNSRANTASMRVCQKLGARLLRVARLPVWHELYKEGGRFVNVYEWMVE